jgi:alginate O-acetyltransferase complex protein AlgI
MLFNTSQYGAFFLVVFTIHWLLPRRFRHPFLLIASYIFYASSIPQYVLLILGLTAFNYGISFWISRARGRARRFALIVMIAGNLASLGYFKYSQLILDTIQPLLKHLPLLSPLAAGPITLDIILPLGISFFTFEFIHYNAEVYKGLRPITNPTDFALFAAFFPTQIAGPIKRFPDFLKQMQHPLAFGAVNFDEGVWLVLRGLVKKIVVADMLAPIVAQLFGKPGALGPIAAWFGVFAFATQIYCDFSGYTDIGRGCAMLLGYVVPENFNSPYQAANPAEFWHRWHMSLSTWLRDYLYIPLGGSRASQPRVYLNLMITMALGGLWHGASWHFMVWGIYQGVLLCAHRLFARTAGRTVFVQRLGRMALLDFLRRPATLVLVCIGWIFFRAASVGAALQMLGSMFAFHRPLTQGLTVGRGSTPVLLVAIAALVVVGGWCWSMLKAPARAWWETWSARTSLERFVTAFTLGLRPAVAFAALLLLVLWPPHAVQTFIYFRF